MVKILLILIYPWFLVARVVRDLLGKDTLQLREPSGEASYWLVREPVNDMQSYFSEDSLAEGKPVVHLNGNKRTAAGVSRRFVPIFSFIGKFYAPKRLRPGEIHGEQATEGIPDEIYTLW
jgi:hypothetical protein